MRTIRKNAWRCLLFSSLIVLMLYHPGFTETDLLRPATIRVVMDNNYPPYVFLDDTGKAQGILIDQWRLWEEKTGITVDIHAMDWGEALRRMEAGEFDVIDTIFFSREREKIYDFTRPYAKIEIPIYFHKEIAGIIDTNTLKGFVVGVKTGDASIDFLANKGITNLQKFSSYEAIIQAAKDHRTAVFVVDKPAAEYFLYKMNIHNDFRHTKSLYTGEFHRAVRKGNKALLSLVENGFLRISTNEYRAIDRKWFGFATAIGGYLHYVGIAAGVTGALVLLLFAWNLTLRKKVEKKTAELKRETEQLNKSTRALRENENLLLCMTTAALDAIIMMNEEGCITYWNKAAGTMFGYSEEEARGMDLHKLLAPTEYLHAVRAGLGEYRKDEAGPVLNGIMEMTAFAKDDRRFPIELSVAPLFIGGKRQAVVIVRDISERKRIEEVLRESEERWRLFMEHNPIYVFFKDEQIRAIQLSRNYERLLGRPIEELLGKTMYDLFPSDFARKMIEDDKKVLSEGILVEVEEEFNDRYYTTIKFPIARDGKPSILAGFTIEITHRKQAEQEKVQLEAQLRQAQKMEAIGTLAGGVAHDFNNILTVLIGFASLLERKMKEADPRMAYVKQILSSAERAAHLTQSLLAFSRKQPIDLSPLQANAVVKNTVKLLKQLLTEDIELKMELTGGTTTIMADSVQIGQVLINLATNARDAMPQGGTLTIRTRRAMLDEVAKTEECDKPVPCVLISVSDTGIGMDEKTLEHIFDPFFTTKGVGKGTGLGLSSVYGTIKQHNGNITVSSKPGHGTTFTICLPFVNNSEGTRASQEQGIGKGAETILIAEDDPGVRSLISETLREQGYRTVEAEDGEAAVRTFRENKDVIDLIVTDVIMPKMNGREVYEAVIKINPHIKVLFTSGYADDTLVGRGVSEQIFEFMPKPLSPNMLLLKVRQVLDK